MVKNAIVEFSDAERIRNKLHMNVEKFSEFIGISRATYYAWKYRGISGSGQKLLRLIEHNLGEAVNAL
jgi:DNA-binding transcriptional regulator YiaG